MKIALYNPHVDDFVGCPPHYPLLRRRALKKYGFLIDSSMTETVNTIVFYDGNLSAFIPVLVFERLPNIVRNIIAFVEVYVWMLLNGVEKRLVRVTSNPEDLRGFVLFTFSYKNALGDFSKKMDAFNQASLNIFHLSHYFLHTAKKSENLRLVPRLFLAGDSDITENLYFQKHFGWYKKGFLVLPFSVQDRFVRRQPIETRINKCLATGTFHRLDLEPKAQLKEFNAFYQIDTYHPVRKAIFNLQKDYENYFECRVSYFRDYSKKGKLSKFVQKFRVSQKNYFKHDIVKTYNSYTYALIGEEITGFPGIGSFEAMACGCILFGIKTHYYGLGLLAGEHFLSYNGDIASIPEIMKTIDYDKMRKISDNAIKFIDENFRDRSIVEKWLKEIFSALNFQNKV